MEHQKSQIHWRCINAPVTMKAMIELFGFMKSKMVDDVYTRVVSQTAATSSSDLAAESLARRSAHRATT